MNRWVSSKSKCRIVSASMASTRSRSSRASSGSPISMGCRRTIARSRRSIRAMVARCSSCSVWLMRLANMETSFGCGSAQGRVRPDARVLRMLAMNVAKASAPARPTSAASAASVALSSDDRRGQSGDRDEVTRGVNRQRRAGAEFGQQRRPAARPGHMHRGKERHDPLQDSEQEGHQPAAERHQTEQRRPARSGPALQGREAEQRRQRQHHPGDAHQQERQAEPLAHAGRESDLHQPQMQQTRRQRRARRPQ